VKRISPEDLKKILEAHKEWVVSGHAKGERADLSGAYLSDADLSGADLRGAYLSDADLRGAYLSGADLRGAYLSGADLRGAYLSGADLRGAYLSDADLRGAYLSDADLSGAYLSDADLRGADLSGAYLSDADLRGAYLSGADLSGAYLSAADLRGAYLRSLLAVPDLDKKILEAIESGGSLQMNTWHTCETTHCRAGWAVTIAGEKGKLLEAIYGTNAAAALIYAASRPDKQVPDFFASNEAAMASIQADAAS
jgi:Pentapeptide repeats (8 copies)